MSFRCCRRARLTRADRGDVPALRCRAGLRSLRPGRQARQDRAAGRLTPNPGRPTPHPNENLPAGIPKRHVEATTAVPGDCSRRTQGRATVTSRHPPERTSPPVSQSATSKRQRPLRRSRGPLASRIADLAVHPVECARPLPPIGASVVAPTWRNPSPPDRSVVAPTWRNRVPAHRRLSHRHGGMQTFHARRRVVAPTWRSPAHTCPWGLSHRLALSQRTGMIGRGRGGRRASRSGAPAFLSPAPSMMG